ncbi:MAG: 4Fe-4S binding protein, partial [Methyloligellaceae bacterium]
SFRGSGFVRGGLFDRFQLIQNENAIRFRDKQYKRLSRVAATDAPRFQEIALLRIPENVKFDPTEPWRVQLLVGREIGPRDKAFLTFDLDYRLPSDYFRVEETKPANPISKDNPLQASSKSENSTSILDTPLWERLWKQKSVEVVILIIALVILTIIFFFQDWLAQRPQLTDKVRLGFLIFTLFGIGFYANAQLSLVNVLTFFSSLLSGFNWNYFLREPLIFLLWFGVAASLIYWGRGAFCGWLCPFGALQELVNRTAKYFKVPQFAIPWSIHERLWPLKYMIFMVIFGISLNSLALAETLAEIEPFKTVIILKFAREWPFVLFAVALLAAGLFIERFYCRYLCPLGAALAIPGKIRLFEWLKRYKHCGSPCQLCASECMVQAIHPEGQINPNECLYCLHCQTVYHNQHRCPVVIQRRLRQKSRDFSGPAIQNPTAKAGSTSSGHNNNTLQGIHYNRSKSNEKIE